MTPRRIVLTGTFDVRNYGDLLFPLIAEQRLQPYGLQVIAASPTARATGWRDAMPPLSLDQALASQAEFDGVLIGGGNIIHAHPVTLADYVAAGVAERAYPDLWLGATQAAARMRVPVAWNAPGVPGAFAEADRPALRAALDIAAYLSVRDAASAGFLESTPHSVRIVPDTALGLARLWPAVDLATEFRALLAGLPDAPPGPYVAIHLKERALDEPLSHLAQRLTAFSRQIGRTPILIGIGACHGDDVVTAALAAAMPGPIIDFSRPAGLRQIAAAIAVADGYVGASLHGYITATSYGRPGVIVGRPRLPKMQGLLTQIGRPDDEAATWGQALAQMAGRIDGPRPAPPAEALAAIDTHWRAVAKALLNPLPAPVLQAMTRYAPDLAAAAFGV